MFQDIKKLKELTPTTISSSDSGEIIAALNVKNNELLGRLSEITQNLSVLGSQMSTLKIAVEKSRTNDQTVQGAKKNINIHLDAVKIQQEE